MGNKGKVLKIAWQVIEKIIITLLVFFSLIIVVQKIYNNEKAFLGFRMFKVETGSMEPKYNVGDVILIKEKDIDKIKVGDDVTYSGLVGTMKGKIVTHQVVDIEIVEGKKVFHTKGIANNIEDPVISGSQIKGVVLGEVHLLTLITSGLTNHYILYFCGIVPLTIYIFFNVLRSTNRKYRDEEEENERN